MEYVIRSGNQRVKDVLHYLSNPTDFFNLYKILEVITKDLGKSSKNKGYRLIEKRGWAPKKDLDAFDYTANNVHRHWNENRPAPRMNLQEAVIMSRQIVMGWVAELAGLVPPRQRTGRLVAIGYLARDHGAGATLVDIVEAHDSHWFTGPYGWIFDNPEPLDNPVAMKGHQGQLFSLTLEKSNEQKRRQSIAREGDAGRRRNCNFARDFVRAGEANQMKVSMSARGKILLAVCAIILGITAASAEPCRRPSRRGRGGRRGSARACQSKLQRMCANY
jgi:hypothetical protein